MDKESTEVTTSKLWDAITFIFSKPAIAALIVGSTIHMLFAANELMSFGLNYFGSLYENLHIAPWYTFLKIFIPFAIPLTITSVSRKITIDQLSKSLLRFPQSNPDIVMKVNAEGKIVYQNPAMVNCLNDFSISLESPHELLPDNYMEIVNKLKLKDATIKQKKLIKGKVLDFTFRCFQDERAIFISGRDITKRAGLESSLSKAYTTISEMTDFLDSTFESFDPDRFNLNEHYLSIIATLLNADSTDSPDNATHIFLTNRDTEGNLTGHIYTLSNETNGKQAKVIKDPETITIKPQMSKVAITLGQDEVVYSNWEEDAPTLEEYQRGFHERVRAKVGIIERFTTYHSGDVAIIAFYKGQRVDQFSAQVLKGLAVFANSLTRISEQSKQTDEAFRYTVSALARASEANDEDTGKHIMRVNEYSMILATELGLDKDFVDKIHYSAQMHDVGKIHVHPDILRKEGPLDNHEYSHMIKHPEFGAKILGQSPKLSMAAEIALTHHEKFDGGGYPNNLKGEEIPISGRIVMVSDVYDALRQKRSYKPAFPHERAVEIITKGDNRTKPEDFDPKVIEAFMKSEKKFQEIFDNLKDNSDMNDTPETVNTISTNNIKRGE